MRVECIKSINGYFYRGDIYEVDFDGCILNEVGELDWVYNWDDMVQELCVSVKSAEEVGDE